MLALPHIALCLLAAQATAAVRDESGSDNPVAKVISLLEDMKKKVEDEGKAEAKTYDEFACFCKDNTKTKSEAITKGNDKIDSLSASIQQLVADEATKADDLDSRKEKHEELTGKLTEEQARCMKEMAEFDAEVADLAKAVKGLTGAVDAMKKSQGASLLEVRKAVGESLALADALGLVQPSRQRGVQALLQQGVDPTAPEYKFHSDEIVKTLEDLLKEFTKKKTDTEAEMKKAKTACDLLKKTLSDQIKTNKDAMKKLEQDIQGLRKKAAQDREDLGKEEGLLQDSQLYLKDLTERCEDRAGDWDQRSDMRGKEIKALTEALGILKDGKDGKSSIKAMDAEVNKRALAQLRHVRSHGAPARPSPAALPGLAHGGAGAAAPSLLQAARGLRGARSGAALGQERAASLLRSEGDRLRSGMLSALATNVAMDPFDKVKTLIQDLIERLLKEATQEATKRGFCNLELGKAKKDREFRFADITKLSADLGDLEAKKESLEAENKELTKSLKETNDALKKAGEERAKEKAQNLKTIKTAKEGLAAVSEAITVLKVFYGQAAKASALVQASPVDEDTSGPGFSSSYTGQQEASTGVIGLLEVVQGDFDRTARKTQESEEKAVADFVKFDRASKVSIKTMETTMKLNKEELQSTGNAITQTVSDMKSAQAILDAALKTIEDLKPMCIDTGMAYDERKKKREEEIKALKKALDLLKPAS